jgi:hypothetical protein
MGRSKQPGVCLHCGRHNDWRTRNLCTTCYKFPEIREQYPMVKNCRGGMNWGNSAWEALLNQKPESAVTPTDAFPGSDEKIAVMAERYANNQAVFHPDDVTCFTTLAHASGWTERDFKALA